MKVISYNDIKKLNITPIQCYEWVEEAIKQKNNAILPPKISMKLDSEGTFYNTMPSVLFDAGYAGVKLVTRYKDREPSLDATILLYDVNTGENIAVVDGDWITTMRTGAVAAHSVKMFSKPDFKVIGMIGLGNTARATLDILVAVFPERNFLVKLMKYKNQHESFIERFSDKDKYGNVKFEVVDTYEKAIIGSDVVISAATFFGHDICDDTCFDEGILVVPVHTRGFGNCDLFFDKFYGDDTGHIEGFKNFQSFKSKFAEVSDVVNGKATGRQSDKERIIAYNVGISLYDIFFAGKLYEMAKNDCQDISLDKPMQKFWV